MSATVSPAYDTLGDLLSHVIASAQQLDLVTHGRASGYLMRLLRRAGMLAEPIPD
jgi:hypothetical protein